MQLVLSARNMAASSDDDVGKGEEIDIAARIKDMSDKISLSQSSSSADRHRQVSSSIGSESPIGILSELRESQERILSLMKEMLLVSEEKDITILMSSACIQFTID